MDILHLFVNLLADGDLDCFYFWLLWIILLRTFVHKFSYVHGSTSFSYIPQSGIVWSYGNFRFNFMRNCQMFFQSDRTILHSHQPCMKVPISLFSCQYLLLSIIFIKAILVGVKWHLIVVSIAFPWWLMMLSISRAFWPFVLLLQRKVYSNPLPILKLGYLSFYFWVRNLFIHSGYQTFIMYSRGLMLKLVQK